MARCYYLDYESGTIFSNGVYRCKLSGQEFSFDSAQVKFTCNATGEKYKSCPVYKYNR